MRNTWLKDMVLVLVVCFALLGACGGASSAGEIEGDEPGECDDGADNDGDGLFDCNDSNCAGSLACSGGDADADSDSDSDSDSDTDADASGCGDQNCADDEDASSCPDDCPAFCGDDHCTHMEDTTSCEEDCPAICGDSECEGANETAATCEDDCPAVCPDGLCTHTETVLTCEDDCPAVCPDSHCTHAETPLTCEADCPEVCPDGFCSHTETVLTCEDDCPAVCGDGICSHDETLATCGTDCCAGGVMEGDYNINSTENLTALSGYSSVTGNLTIEAPDLTDLNGLECLEEIGGNLYIGYWETGEDTNELCDDGEDNDEDGYTDCEDFSCSHNGGVVVCEYEGNGNNGLTNLNGLSGLTSVGAGLSIRRNAELTNLSGLSSLTSVGGYLFIYENALLANLNGLNSLTSVGDYLNITLNVLLPTCAATEFEYRLRRLGWNLAATIGGNNDSGTCNCLLNSGYPCPCDISGTCDDGSDCLQGANDGLCSTTCTGADDTTSCASTYGTGGACSIVVGAAGDPPNHCIVNCTAPADCNNGLTCTDSMCQ